MSENQLLPDSLLTQADVDFIDANRPRPAPNNFKDSMLNEQDVNFIIASNPRLYRKPEYNQDIAGAMDRKYLPANVLANQRNLVKEASQVLTFPEGGTTEDKYNYYRDVAKQEEAKRRYRPGWPDKILWNGGSTAGSEDQICDRTHW